MIFLHPLEIIKIVFLCLFYATEKMQIAHLEKAELGKAVHLCAH
jgi:hypothetical protein